MKQVYNLTNLEHFENFFGSSDKLQNSKHFVDKMTNLRINF
jgi:hypothetical protein